MSFYGLRYPPYRAFCSGQKPMIGMGGCFQHKKKSEDNIPRFTNVSKVADYHLDGAGDPVDPAGVAPYSRPDSVYPDCYSPGDPLPNSLYKCGPWPIGERPSSAGANGVLIDYNVYERIADAVANYSSCRKLGFKLVQARKVFQGIFGFTSVDRNVWGPFCDATDSGKCGCDYRGYQPIPDQTKYLKATGVASSITNGSLDTPNESYMTRTTITGRYTGDNAYTVDGTGDDDGAAADVLIGHQNDHIGTLSELYCAKVAANDNVDMVFTHDGDFAWTVTWTHIGGGGEESVGTIVVDQAAGTYSCDIQIKAGGPSTPVTQKDQASLTLTPTTAVWYQRFELIPTPGNNNLTTENCTITLSNPYTAAELEADRNTLLAQWPLNDDVLYPWRVDAALEVGPIVSYDETDLPTIPILQDDPSDAVHSGAIRGAPLPRGYGAHFDFDHYNGASPDGSFGKLNPGPAPATATRWTLDVTAQPLGPGGWWRHAVAGVSWAQKWAEILVRRPSYNFFGPWGKQRYSLDEKRTGCVTNAVGSPVVITVVFDGAAPTGANAITSGTLCYYGGKIYNVTRNTDTEYVMTNEIANVPAAAQPDGDVFGPLRFPAAWPIGGRVGIVSAAQNGVNVDFVIAGPSQTGDASWLRTYDDVVITGVNNVTSGGVTVTDATHFSVPGTLGADYVSGGYVSSFGAPDYKWFDSQPRGEFVTNEWQHDYRDYQIADYLCLRHNGAYCVCDNDDFDLVTCPGAGTTSDVRALQATHGMAQSVKVFNPVQRCVPFDPCQPQVVCISPNATDIFKNGIKIDFGSFSADDTWGSAWQMAVQQNMASPDEQNRDSYLWQPPHKSCAAYAAEGPSYSFNWNEDDGSCLTDATPDYYFPQRQWFECRLTTDGAPDLPADVKLGFATLYDLDYATLPAGTKPVAPPPPLHEGVSNVPVEWPNAPWVIYEAQVNCVCAIGRFATEYEANDVICPT